MFGSTVTVRDLRRQWKPHKERLNVSQSGHPTAIRFHRACSWLQRAEQLTETSDLGLTVLSQWIAFNALYGQWDDTAQEPLGDVTGWRCFVDRMLALDETGIINDVLMANKPLVMSLFDDEYLSRYYWQEPTDKRAHQSKKVKYDARTWFLTGKWALILDRVIERIYLLRCQLVHGAATYNSSLNRAATRHCAQMMDHLLRAFLMVWIQHGADEDWGSMCYPPLTRKAKTR
jgi:hypothetical protein